jgi:protein tyrosine phosphatase (PTP) superfamily phosphohydrolase (DUF442 family)
MTSNTLTTIVGFFGTLLSKYTPLKLSKDTLEGIYNYHTISSILTTSGQPSEQQFLLIRDADYSSVVNLAPHNTENSLTDEALLVEQLGLKYTHIPVDFKNPTNEDFEKFIILMGESKSEKTWIHCAANMRVSAFIYKYRLEVLNHDAKQAEIDLKKIWEPYGVWKQFIKKANG